MGITLVGCLWTLIILIYLKKGRKAFLNLLLISLLFQCDNFIIVGGIGVGVHLITVAVGIIVFFPMKKNSMTIIIRKKPKSLSFFKASFVILLFIVFFGLYKNGIELNVVHISMLLAYIVLFIELTEWTDLFSPEEIDNIIKKSLIIVSIVGVLQVMAKSGATLFHSPLQILVYNDVNNPSVCFNNKPLNALYSTFMEPSFCGAYLVSCFSYLSLKKIESSKDIVWLFIVGVEILLTRSSTAYIGLAIVMVIVSINGKRKSTIKYALPLIAVCILVFVVLQYQFVNGLLNDVIFEKTMTASYKVRSSWNEHAIENYLRSPVIGIGYKQSRASSFVLTMLAETGILGLLCILIQIVILVKNRFFSEYDYRRQTSMFVLAMYICQSIAVPDLIFSPLWFGLYLFVLSNTQKDNLKCKETKI